MTIPNKLERLKSKIAQAAQRVYDEWNEDPDEYFGGGICHLIADAIVDVLGDHNIDAVTMSCSVGEVHVNSVALYDDSIYLIDISPYTYEKGGGYSWKKSHDVEFDVRDIIIERLGPAEDWEEYSDVYSSYSSTQTQYEHLLRRAMLAPNTYYYIRNTEKAPDMGSTFGQDIEPAGIYVSLMTPQEWKGIEDHKLPRWEYGTVTIKNPLVVEWKTTRHGGWKSDLAEQYGATGSTLSHKLRKAGYDAVVTVDKQSLSETVLLKDTREPMHNTLASVVASLKLNAQYDLVREITSATASVTQKSKIKNLKPKNKLKVYTAGTVKDIEKFLNGTSVSKLRITTDKEDALKKVRHGQVLFEMELRVDNMTPSSVGKKIKQDDPIVRKEGLHNSFNMPLTFGLLNAVDPHAFYSGQIRHEFIKRIRYKPSSSSKPKWYSRDAFVKKFKPQFDRLKKGLDVTEKKMSVRDITEQLTRHSGANRDEVEDWLRDLRDSNKDLYDELELGDSLPSVTIPALKKKLKK